MPGKIKEITFPDGETRKVEEMDFKIVKEDWNEYQLVDGTTLKTKSILMKVYWVLDPSGKRMYTPAGDPSIIINSVNQVVASERG